MGTSDIWEYFNPLSSKVMVKYAPKWLSFTFYWNVLVPITLGSGFNITLLCFSEDVLYTYCWLLWISLYSLWLDNLFFFFPLAGPHMLPSCLGNLVILPALHSQILNMSFSLVKSNSKTNDFSVNKWLLHISISLIFTAILKVDWPSLINFPWKSVSIYSYEHQDTCLSDNNHFILKVYLNSDFTTQR